MSVAAKSSGAAGEGQGVNEKLGYFRRCPRCGHRAPWVTRCRVCGAPGRRCNLALAGLALVLVATLLFI
ncbi:MAG TPA: hypothetical protein VF669_02500 [Tepidisphaeraceae bacterium]|jgi:hypothetical protein